MSFDWTPHLGGASASFNEEGDTVVGTVTAVGTREGRSGEVPVVTVADAEGHEKDIWCGASDLRQQMASANVQVGDRVKVTLVGTKNIGQPSPLKLFEVKVKRGEAPAPAPEPVYEPGEEPF